MEKTQGYNPRDLFQEAKTWIEESTGESFDEQYFDYWHIHDEQG
jgi:hypothetical protein